MNDYQKKNVAMWLNECLSFKIITIKSFFGWGSDDFGLQIKCCMFLVDTSSQGLILVRWKHYFISTV